MIYLQPLNDSSMIVSALSSYIQDSDKTLTDIVRCYPLISYFDDDGSSKVDVMNKYFIMFQGADVKNSIRDKQRFFFV